jgi:hypothetical protein
MEDLENLSMNAINDEAFRIQQMEAAYSDIPEGGFRNAFTEYLQNMKIKIAKTRLAILMTPEELTTFGIPLGVQRDKIRENETVPTPQN